METGRRQVGLGEALILGNLLGTGLHELVLGSGEPTLSVGGVVVTTEQLERMIEGSPVLTGGETSAHAHVEVMTTAFRRRVARLCDSLGIGRIEDVVEKVEAAAHGGAEQAAGRELGVSPEEVAAAALALWGRSLTAERRSRRRSASPNNVSELLEIRQLIQRSDKRRDDGNERGDALAR